MNCPPFRRLLLLLALCSGMGGCYMKGTLSALRKSLTLIWTAAVMGINLDTLRPEPSVEGHSTPGGYSSKAVKPIALAKARCHLPNTLGSPPLALARSVAGPGEEKHPMCQHMPDAHALPVGKAKDYASIEVKVKVLFAIVLFVNDLHCGQEGAQFYPAQ